MPNGRCRIHGGASLRGAQHPNAKTLAYSKYLPDRLAARYAEMEQDPDLLTLVREVALVRTRLTELIGYLDEGLGTGALERIEDAFTALRQAMAAQDKAATEAAWGDLGVAIAAAKGDFALWDDIYLAINILTRTSESERKRLVEAEYMVKLDSVMNFVGAVAGILRETIKDRETIMVIQAKVQRLLEVKYGSKNS
jgi:hypothetical protein